MKKILTLLLTFFVLFSYGQNEHFIDSVFATSKRYKDRFIPDGGTMLSDRLTKAYMLMAEKHGMADNIEFGWMSGGASKKRVDGINQFYTNLYDFYGTNDAYQTTAVNQPYVSGNIAPNEVECIKLPGTGRFFAHPEISFTKDEAWSLTFTINWDNLDQTYCFIISNVAASRGIGLKSGNNGFFIRKPNLSYILGTPNGADLLIGKTKTISFIYNTEKVDIYIDGSFHETLAYVDPYTFSMFGGQNTNYPFTGNWKAHIIRSIALTPEQVAAEHALLREIYPEIPSVKIGDQTWSTSNLEMVATPEGNVIKNVTDNTEWRNATNVYDSVYAATSGTAAEKEYAALKESAYWCYYNNDPSLGAVYGKLYNWYAAKLLDLDMASAGFGWRVPTQAQFETLINNNSAQSLKVGGINYWTNDNGTNITGFSGLGAGYRGSTGIPGYFKVRSVYWTSVESVRGYVYDDNNKGVLSGLDLVWGVSLRLIKDSE